MNNERERPRDKRYAAVLLFFAILLFGFFLTNHRASISFPSNAARSAGNAAPFPGFPIDINSASREDLMMLPGIGQKTADRIVEERERLNGFKSLEELLNVKYIGDTKLRAIRPFVIVKKKDRGNAG